VTLSANLNLKRLQAFAAAHAIRQHQQRSGHRSIHAFHRHGMPNSMPTPYNLAPWPCPMSPAIFPCEYSKISYPLREPRLFAALIAVAIVIAILCRASEQKAAGADSY
jgi:hypothetical protein